MKTKLFVLGLVAVIVAMSSCKKDPEKMIVGTWDNTEVKVDPIDSLANYYMMQSMFQIQMYRSMMQGSLTDSAGNENDSIKMYLAQLDSIEATINLDTIKANILDSKLGMATFNEDKTFKDSVQGQIVNGSWNFVGDSLILTINNKNFSYHLDDISKKSFTITTSDLLPDSTKITYSYVFTRK